MDIHLLRVFFMWCTLIDAGLLIVSFLIFAWAGNWIYRMHSRWFPLSKESFHTAIYSLLGLMKIAVILLNLVPYIALVIIEG